MGARILVVDDDDGLLQLTTIGLREAGYEVFSARDGEEGLACARRHKPDLMVLDLAMPRMNGYEVCEAVKKDADLKSTKIIILSGKNYAVDKRTAKELGADDYFVKPCNLDELLARVKILVGSS